MPQDNGFKYRLTPHLRVRNAANAIKFYQEAFGAIEVDRYTAPDGVIAHAQLKIGDAAFSLAEESPVDGSPGPQTLSGSSVSIDLIVPDADSVAKQAVELGARIQYPIQDQFYGLRQGRIIDPFGHLWSIGSPLKR
jgi:PhnB protein